jgi:hypothetical protein
MMTARLKLCQIVTLMGKPRFSALPATRMDCREYWFGACMDDRDSVARAVNVHALRIEAELQRR